MTAMPWAPIVVAAFACVTDLRTRKIPNVLTFGGAVAALVTHGVTNGFAGIGFSAAGWAVGLALFFPLFLLRGMGAGDVKLLAALGAWVGPGAAVWLALWSAIAGGVSGRGRRAGARLREARRSGTCGGC